MHPVIYSSRLVDSPADLSSFRLTPGDHLRIDGKGDAILCLAPQRRIADRIFGLHPRPIGRVCGDHATMLRAYLAERKHLRVRVVDVVGLPRAPEGIVISVWVES